MNVAALRSPMLERAVAGEPAALAALLAATRPDLSRYARRHCQSQDVEDAVQDALWIIHQRLGSLRHLSSFAGWSFRIVKRLCLALSVAEARRRCDGVTAPEPADPATDAESRLIILSAIAALPTHYREALIAVDILGETAVEAAARIGIGVEAGKARLHRARMLVRAALIETAAGEDLPWPLPARR